MSWTQYQLTFQGGADIDTILFQLFEYGLEGSYVDTPLDIIRTDDGYDYRINEEEGTTIITFSKEALDDEWWKERFGLLGWTKTEKVEATLQTGEEWKEQYSPISISSTIQLIPEWVRGSVECETKYCLYIEPGAAFGTGLHGTTQDCMRLLEQLDLNQKRVLDVGSGSGVLSILAKKMGATHVYALDSNPSAELELHKNMSFNLLDEGIESISGDAFLYPFPHVDVVLSNIGLKENLELLPKFKECLAEEGDLITSGIIEWGEAEFTREMNAAGFIVKKSLRTDEWASIWFKKRKTSLTSD